MDKLISGWEIHDLWLYALVAFICQLGVRLISSILRAVELASYEHEPFFSLALKNFGGFHSDDKHKTRSDFWFPSILGFLELLAFPVLMAVQGWNIIGAWIGFKTIAQWSNWKENRSSFNRYLIGNALIVIISLLVLVPYVSLK